MVAYNIPRELPRTLYSLSSRYQRHIQSENYEVIVVDNGSVTPIQLHAIEGLRGNFRVIRMGQPSSSPAAAVNFGLAHARGDIIGVMIDGARIATPGLLHFALHGAVIHERSVVVSLGWHLGYDFQRWAMQVGYDQVREDLLLSSIDWPADGYRLFEIGTMDESSVDGWLAPIAESNALFMRRKMWRMLSGVDERFDAPGGGIVNLDLFRRAAELSESELVILLGEATFHQYHGGVATNASPRHFHDAFKGWADQYEHLRGRPYNLPSFKNPPTYIGTMPRPVLRRFVRAAIEPALLHSNISPLGEPFDQRLWSPSEYKPPSDSKLAALIDLAQTEFRARNYSATAAVARLVLERAPDQHEAQRLLSLVSPFLISELPRVEERYEFNLALGDAYRILGEVARSGDYYHAALHQHRDSMRAHVGLATLRMPGDLYYVWLERLYKELAPSTIIEIGVGEGRSLACAQPPSIVVGVDPSPRALFPLKTTCYIFSETSDSFFERGGPDEFLTDQRLGIGFIDGLHVYEQALRDFVNLEKVCSPRSVILIHDTIPVNEISQRRSPETQFHTGDVWKLVLCLRYYRKDLDVFTIATGWTGLTVVIGLDPMNHTLSEGYAEAVARFVDTPYSEIANDLGPPLNIIPNDWNVVRSRLLARGIL